MLGFLGRKFRGIFQNIKPKHVVWKLCACAQSVCNERTQSQTLALNINISKALKRFCIVISSSLFCGFVICGGK